MYLIFYQKRDGEIICRIRNTIPEYGIGKITSMGWKVIDIKHKFKSSYYSISEYNKLESNMRKKINIYKTIKKCFNKYIIQIIFVIILFILLKK